MTTLRIKFLSSMLLVTSFVTSCGSDSPDNEVLDDQNPQELAVISAAIDRVDRFQMEIDRGSLLTQLRQSERSEVEKYLYYAKVALHRLLRDIDDKEAGQQLGDAVDGLAMAKVVVTDYQQVMDLVQYLRIEVMDVVKVRYRKNVFVESFSSKSDLGYFTSFSTKGKVSFSLDMEYKTAKISSFNVKQEVETWLISPILNLQTLYQPSLKLRQKVGYLKSWEGLDVLISTNYRGNHPENATWTVIDIQEKPDVEDDRKWKAKTSEDISLEAYTDDSIVLAFRYRQGPSNQPTWEIEFVELAGQEVEDFKLTPLNFTNEAPASSETVTDLQRSQKVSSSRTQEKTAATTDSGDMVLETVAGGQ